MDSGESNPTDASRAGYPTVAGFATASGTSRVRSGRLLGKTGLLVSPLGFGTYRVDASTTGASEALALALKNGCNLIDTSTNYRGGDSESLIGSVLRDVLSKEELRRDEFIIISKVGYAQGQTLIEAQSREALGNPFPELVHLGPDLAHCIHPNFISEQLTHSLGRLGLKTLDGLLLHNPEYYLKTSSDHVEYYRRIRQAFDALESEVQNGRIRFYGISSNSFGDPRESPTFTSLEAILDFATPENYPHFQVIQFPLNLFEPGPLFELNQTGKTVLELASARGLGTLTNRPLNAFHGQKLVRLTDVEAPREIDIEEEVKTAFLEALQVEEKFPNGSDFDSSRVCWAHILRHHLAKLDDLDFWVGVRDFQIRPSLEEADAEMIHEGPSSLLVGWRELHKPKLEHLLKTVTEWIRAKARTRSTQILTQLDLALPGLKSLGLARASVELLKAAPGVDCVLVGMRKPEYVQELLIFPAPISLTTEQVLDCFDAVLSDTLEETSK